MMHLIFLSFCYQCDMHELADDELVDYFRKRVPIYMMRYTIPRIVMREYQNFRQISQLVEDINDIPSYKVKE